MFSFNQKKETQLKGDEFVPPPNTTTYTQYNPLKDVPELYAGQQYVYKLPANLESLFEEEGRSHGRTTMDNLTFYTGTSWACGSLVGGAKGIVEGLKAVERGDSLKIRVNRLLNSTGSVGRRVANRGAVLGILFTGIDGGIKYLGEGFIEDDLRLVLAGVGTGALFRVFGGGRSVAVGAAVGGVLAGAYLGGRELVNRFGPDLKAKF